MKVNRINNKLFFRTTTKKVAISGVGKKNQTKKRNRRKIKEGV